LACYQLEKEAVLMAEVKELVSLGDIPKMSNSSAKFAPISVNFCEPSRPIKFGVVGFSSDSSSYCVYRCSIES
jgi:hypothetical protein